MKQSKIYRKLLSVALAAVMVLSLTNGLSVGKARAAEDGGYRLTWEEVENNGKGLLHGRNKTEAAFEENYVKNGMVRVSILLEGDATLKKFPAKNIAANAAATSYRAGLRAKQDEMAQTISRKVLNGEKLDVVWNITLAANIISANIPYEKLDAVRNIIGVKDVVLETRYEALVASKDENDPNMSTASEMVGGNFAWAAGLTGAGSKIAIVDTGLDLEHQSFNGAAFEESLKGKTVDLLEAAEVASVFSSLNAAKFLSGADGIYRSAKVPYGVNYVDKGLDVTHMGDRQGEHGSHVAGIAAANSLIPDGNGGFKNALETVKTQGEAPDAQLLIMKVFGKGGGASDSDYMVAIEDAILLGADAVNLSLGSGNPGLVTNNTYNRILTEVAEATNLVWCNSAGNSYNWAQYSSQGFLYGDDVSFATGGSPATYAPTLSVASVVNKGQTGQGFTAADVFAIYNESATYGNPPLTTIAGEYDYVLLDGPGVDDNNHVGQAGDDFMALGKGVVEGKVAFCYRGSSSFFAKANAAAKQGAKAVVIINNAAGVIGLNLTGYTEHVPVVSLLKADGDAIKAASEKVTDASGNTYYTGKITISEGIGTSNPGENFTYTMSDFSSWGVPGDLSMKPEITTPGGNIYSIFGHSYTSDGVEQGGPDQYENMSGTSMASPQMAGLVALFAQYIRENDLTTKTGRSARQLALSLLMSTAVPMRDANEEYFPVIQQGSGLANINNAINAKSYITIDGVAETAPLSAASAISEGKVKVELGELKEDSFTTEFTLHNFSDEKVTYDLNADFFTQLIYPIKGGNVPYRLGYIDYLNLAYEWTIDGQEYEPLDIVYDFNGDYAVNGKDAQHLLNYCAGLVEESKLYNAYYADLDEDGDIDTNDARLAFEGLNAASVDVDSKDVKVTLKVSGLSNAIKSENGNFIEGYIFVKESDSEDGAIGVGHSIPVLGFYGNWTDGSMFDKGDVIAYTYGLEDRLPYLYGVPGGFSGNEYSRTGFTINNYVFTGNPMAYDYSIEDTEQKTPLYLPERNAISKDSVINSVAYTQIRNAGASRFFLTDKDGNVVFGTERTFGASYSAFYYVNQSTWNYRSSSRKLNFSPATLTEGESYVLNYQAAPEYYLNADGSVRWDDLGKGSIYSLPVTVDNTAPTMEEPTFDGETKKLTVKAQDDRWIAAVALWTEDEELVDYFGGFAEHEKGQAYDYEFDLSELVTGAEDDVAHYTVEVYDYAENLKTFRLNLNKDELDDPISVKIKQTASEAVIVNGGKLQLTAMVYPWGVVEDDRVTWSSADESIATVDENGLVTSVATEDSTVKITATSVLDPTASDSITVTIKMVHKELNGFVWDDNGAVWASEFDIATLPRYTKLNAENLDIPLASAAYDQTGKLYAVSCGEFNGDNEVMYTVDTETWELTEVGSLEITYADICQAPSLGDNYLLAVYAYYVVIVNKTTGAYEGLFNFSKYLTNDEWFVGIAYASAVNTGYGKADMIYLLDDSGNLHYTAIVPYEDSYSHFGLNTIGQIGDAVDTPYWQSLYSDGSAIYWSRFSKEENDVDMIMVDMQTGLVLNMGSFADSVWPVGGLFELGVNPGPNSSFAPFDYELAKANFSTERIEKAEKEGKAFTKKIGGSLNAAKGGETAEPDKVSTEVKVDLTAEELTKNGLIQLEIPETVELLRWSSNAQFKAWNDKETGKITFAFVDLEGIAADDVILTLVFSKESAGTVIVTTSDINEDDENEVVEEIELGFAVHDHIYGEPEWAWAEDYSSATATFKCVLKDDTQVLNATITFEDNDADKTRTYTATVEFQGKTYTDSKTVDHSWEPFTWTRLKGTNRYGTMAAITQEGFKEANSAKTVLVALGTDYVSALLAGGLAGALDAPLITAPADTSVAKNMTIVKDELERLAAEGCEVIIIGSASEVNDEVKAVLAGAQNVASVKRLEAATREELAEVLYNYGEGKWTESGTVILANGYNFADTLSASPYAYYAKTPIFYTNEEHALSASTKTFMASGKVKRVVIVGGDAAVSTETEEELKGMGLEVIRLKGAQRYATSAAIVNWACGFDTEAAFQPDKLLTLDNMAVATGLNAADALASVNVVGKKGSALLLVADNTTTNYNRFKENLDGIIKAHKESIYTGYILGGTGAVSEQIEADLNAATAE